MTREEAIEYLHKLFMKADITDAYGDMDDTEPYEIAVDMAVKALQEQKTGKWIVHTEINNVYGGIYIECSECGESYVVQHFDAEIFCRNCGSRNRGEKDER